MWWHWNSDENGRRGNALWFIIPLVIIGILLLSSRNWGWGWSWWWLFFIIPCFLGPKLWRSMNHRDDGDSGDKRKNDFDFEKPKRTITRDDGELEIIDEDPQPRPRRAAPDDIEYV